LLKHLQKEMDLTYLFISHNLRIVKKISQKIAVMYKGKIVELASTQDIFDHPMHPYTQELLLAAVDYKTTKREKPLSLDMNAPLLDRGNGHFVRI